MAAAGRHLAETRYDVNHVNAQLASVLEQALAPRLKPA
jgi:hypothetical protein